MKGKLVSIIIPTYNGEKFIEKTLCAVIEQDYEDLEIIVVDDVSTDNTVKTVRNILEESGRNFQLIQRTVNGHQSAARNTGLYAAKGEYVIFVDHDDLVEKNFVSALYKEIEDKNADLVFCGFELFHPIEKKITYSMLFEKPLGSPEEHLRAWTKSKLELWSIWNYIFNKSFLIRNKIKFPEDLYITEDVEFIFKAVTLSSKISSVNSVLYKWVSHKHQQHVTDSVNRENYKNFMQTRIAEWRAARCIIRHVKDKRIKNYALKELIADRILTHCKLTARAGDREYYDRIIKTLRHKKIREIMLSTVRFIFTKPELFLKCCMLIYAPGLYYSLRKKN